MAEQQETGQAIREWFQILERSVRQVDYQTMRRHFAPDVLSFGTRADVVAGLDALVANQWSGIWPHIREFTIDFRAIPLGRFGGSGVGNRTVEFKRISA